MMTMGEMEYLHYKELSKGFSTVKLAYNSTAISVSIRHCSYIFK